MATAINLSCSCEEKGFKTPACYGFLTLCLREWVGWEEKKQVEGV